MFQIDVADEQNALEVDHRRLRRAAEAILRSAGLEEATLSIAVVDDATIHELNRRHLDHDYPTDVLSFVLEHEGRRLEGEVIVSADTALRTAPGYGWAAGDELLLYVIHGTLHLVGHDDHDDNARATMRAAERECLAEFGLTPRETPD